jgi:hypothetical protein
MFHVKHFGGLTCTENVSRETFSQNSVRRVLEISSSPAFRPNFRLGEFLSFLDLWYVRTANRRPERKNGAENFSFVFHYWHLLRQNALRAERVCNASNDCRQESGSQKTTLDCRRCCFQNYSGTFAGTPALLG